LQVYITKIAAGIEPFLKTKMPYDLAGLDGNSNQLACSFSTPHIVPGLQDSHNSHIVASKLIMASSWTIIIFRYIRGVWVCVFNLRKEIGREYWSHSKFEVRIYLHCIQKVNGEWDRRKFMLEDACLQ
jgi:hypothetical protein